MNDLDNTILALIQAELNAKKIEREDSALIEAYLKGEMEGGEKELPQPEQEEPRGPSYLFKYITALAQAKDVIEPDPFVLGLAVMGEDRWALKHRQAAWAVVNIQSADWFTSHGYDLSLVEAPSLTNTTVPRQDYTKAVTLDTRTGGFIVRFRGLKRDEHIRVMDAIRRIPGWKFHTGTSAGSRMPEPHWTIPGDEMAAKHLGWYLYTSQRHYAEKRDTDYAQAAYWTAMLEELPWAIEDGVKAQIDFLIGRAVKMLPMSEAHFPSAGFKLRHNYESVDGKTPFPYQIAGVEYILLCTRESRHSYGLSGNGVYVAEPMGLGKEQPLDAKLLTPDGWTTMGDIKIDNEVIGADGRPTKVINIFPQGEKDIYRVLFSDGSSTECGLDHLWSIAQPWRKASGYPNKVMSLRAIRDSGLRDGAGNSKYFIPMVRPVEFNQRPIQLDPYLLGALLGDGGLTRGVSFTSADQEIIENVRAALPPGVFLKGKSGSDYDYNITCGIPGGYNSVLSELRNLGLIGKGSHEKFIPDNYKFGSKETRIAILQGLLDTDGTVFFDKAKYTSAISYSSSSKTLAEDVVFLIRSLGGRTSLNIKKTSRKDSYRVHVTLPSSISPFRLSRKNNLNVGRQKYTPSRAIIGIKFIGKKYAQCIRVESSDHLYITDDFIVTHNTIEAGIMATVESWLEEIERNPEKKIEDLRALILCPAATKIGWSREINRWVGSLGFTVQIVRGLGAQPIQANFLIVNPELLKKELREGSNIWEPLPLFTMLLAQRWFAIVADEGHMYANWTAQRTGNALELFSGKRWDSKTRRFVQWRLPVPLRLMLSGTPIMNRPVEFASQLEALGLLESFGGQTRFENEFGRLASASKIHRVKKMKELHYKLRQFGYLRREKETMVLTDEQKTIPLDTVPSTILNRTFTDPEQWAEVLANQGWKLLPGVLGQLPPKIRTIVHLPITNRLSYRKAEKDLLRWISEEFGDDPDIEEKLNAARRGYALKLISTLKRLAEEGKIKAGMKWLEDFLGDTDDQKIVFYTSHLHVQDAFIEHFKGAAIIRGGQSEDQRQRNIDRFQNDQSCRVILCMLQAGGIGITLTAAHHLAFLSLGWNPAKHDQAEDRVWGRVNDLHGASIYYILATDTIDTMMAGIIDNKREISMAATQGADADTSMMTELMVKFVDKARQHEMAEMLGIDEDITEE